jgi:hypothetical protein
MRCVLHPDRAWGFNIECFAPSAGLFEDIRSLLLPAGITPFNEDHGTTRFP